MLNKLVLAAIFSTQKIEKIRQIVDINISARHKHETKGMRWSKSCSKILICALEVTYHSQIIGSAGLLHLADSPVKSPGMLGYRNMSHVILKE